MQNFLDQRDHLNKDKIIFFNEKLQPDLRFKFKVLTPFQKINSQLSNDQKVSCQPSKRLIGGVYMGKLAPARVSYRDDFVISYHVYMMTGFFHHPTSNVLKLTKPSWIDKNYACATRSSLPANRFQTETSGRFAFT